MCLRNVAWRECWEVRAEANDRLSGKTPMTHIRVRGFDSRLLLMQTLGDRGDDSGSWDPATQMGLCSHFPAGASGWDPLKAFED